MLRQRLLILLGGSLLAASAALADDVGYIDCTTHSEETQVFAKARKTPEVVTAVPCGERFTILIYGFVFSRIETRDGKIGFVYSNLIAIDHSGISVRQQAPRTPAAPAPVASNSVAAAAQPNPPAPAPSTAPAAQPAYVQPAAAQPVAAQLAPVAAPAQAAASSPSFSNKSAVVVLSDPPASSQPQPAPAQVAPAPAPAPPAVDPAPAASAPASTSNVTETAPAAPRPDPPAPVPPPPPAPASTASTRPAPAETAPAPEPAPAVRPANVRSSWERPIPSAHTPPRLELFGGYAFNRVSGYGGYSSTNFNGAMGSFGWNFKPWLQIVGDSSYSFITVGNTKNVLYGNHYGPRYYYRRQNRWNLTPFVEGLVGASRADTTVSGAGGYTTSVNCISFKVGGGLDIHPSRHFEIRLFDADYYRTSFGTNAHQTNYWVSAGIVIRLFGGGLE
jgi:hypothetical protein